MNAISGSSEHRSVVVIGGGQAGLSMSWHLKQAGIDHVVLERNRIGHAWRSQRWDSFCLVTPNWQCKLPGFAYDGSEPDGFMVKDDIVRYIESYVASFQPPVREGVSVTRLARRAGGGFEIDTNAGSFTADQVVVAVGGYHTPKVPRSAERLPADIVQIHSVDYRNPDQMPPGDVLIVGSGQSGCQIAEDLHLAGRRVHLCVGSAPRTARRYRGRDVVDWLDDMGHYAMPVHAHPMKEKVRGKANHYVTGRDGGRDIDLRKFAAEGMQLYGRLADVHGETIALEPNLARHLDGADASSDNIKTTIDKYIAQNGISAPEEGRAPPVWQPQKERESLDLRAAGITSIIWSIGYASDYRWIECPIFDGKGYPGHVRGVTELPGLYFLGLPWQYTWGSGRFSGVADDAAFLAECISRLRPGSSLQIPSGDDRKISISSGVMSDGISANSGVLR
jgi:putative flavoprotein involved in K+ transport